MRTLRFMAPRLRTLDTMTAAPAAKTADPFYLTPEWRALVDRLIAARFGSRAHAKCQDSACQQPHRRGIRVFADHVKELRDGGQALDPANILFRCGSCHTRKTIATRAARMARPAKAGGGGSKHSGPRGL